MFVVPLIIALLVLSIEPLVRRRNGVRVPIARSVGYLLLAVYFAMCGTRFGRLISDGSAVLEAIVGLSFLIIPTAVGVLLLVDRFAGKSGR